MIYAFQQRRDKLPPVQINHISFISQFSADIQYIKGKDNIVADSFSRVEAICENVLNYSALADSQAIVPELQGLLKDGSSLILRETIILGTNTKIFCNISTSQARPFITKPFRKQIFDSIHNLSHASPKTTAFLVSRFVWPKIQQNCHAWSRSCHNCQISKISRHVHSPVGTFKSPTSLFQHVHIDIVKMPASVSYKYCLTAIDRFTG